MDSSRLVALGNSNPETYKQQQDYTGELFCWSGGRVVPHLQQGGGVVFMVHGLGFGGVG